MRAAMLAATLLVVPTAAGESESAAATADTPASTGAAASASTTTLPGARAEAAKVAARFQQELGAKLQSALAAGGPVGAIEVCFAEAPAIAERVSRESGWDVRRVGTRVRNPASGRPDAWEQAQLDAFARRLADGERPETVDVYAVVDERGLPTERYMKAIVMAPLCVACHGDPTAQPAELRAKLQARYPDDAATGYRAGDLRGAFTLRRPTSAAR
jgi:hypothetical protein